MSEEEKEQFWRTVQCTVEKDVVRTDRCHPYFSGEGNPNIEILKYVCKQILCFVADSSGNVMACTNVELFYVY